MEFVIDTFEPVYFPLRDSKALDEKERTALRVLEECGGCPRQCRANRAAGEQGVCEIGRHARVSSAFPHHGEEDCLRGTRGSGTIFFQRCNLSCVFCQNWEISQRDGGRECTAEQLGDLMLALQVAGCHNINLVTPEHVVPQVVEGLVSAIRRGLTLPVVYNTSAYDDPASLALLEGLVDIYMPDFKYWEGATAERLSGAGDYPEVARAAVREMHRQVGPLRFGPDGLARRGVLVRHLVMPGLLRETNAILRWIAGSVSRDTWVNLMGQYRPAYLVGATDSDGGKCFSEIGRRPTREEMTRAYRAAEEAGLRRLDDRWLFG
jgi:putative pyruvate formate lyase activating enzyme